MIRVSATNRPPKGGRQGTRRTRMKRTASTIGQGFALGIAALALASGPSFGFGIPINNPAGTGAPVASQVPPPPPVNPATVPADSVPTLTQLPAQYSPKVLDLGTLRGYVNEQ